MTDAQAVTQQTIDSLSASGQEAGLQVAAYLQGEPVVNACAGLADAVTGRPVEEQTLFNSWSTGKGSTSTVVHVLAERGLLDYDTPIADYWPEFRAHGKQTVTLAHVLTHSAGNLATGARALVSGSRVPRATPQPCSANTPSSANRQIQASLLLRPYS